MRRLSPLLLAASFAAACGSSSNTDVCSAFADAVKAKGQACGLTVSSSEVSSCQSAIAACTADDKSKLNAVVTCTNNVTACSPSSTSTFATDLTSCFAQTAPTLSPTCQAALNATLGDLVPSGSSSFTAGSGSCNLTFSGSTIACQEFSSSVAASALAAACVPANCSTAYPGAGCSAATGQCTTSNMLGRCLVPNNGTPYRLTWYGVAGLTTTAAQQACAGLGGTWSST